MRRGRDFAEVGGPGSGWGCRAGAGRQALARSQLCRNPRPGRPAESMRMLEWCGGRLPGAGPHEVGVGALQGHGPRVTAQDAHHPTGQLLDALQRDTHLA